MNANADDEQEAQGHGNAVQENPEEEGEKENQTEQAAYRFFFINVLARFCDFFGFFHLTALCGRQSPIRPATRTLVEARRWRRVRKRLSRKDMAPGRT